MAQQVDSKGELRAANLSREFWNAKRSIPMGSTGVFMRVTLAIFFMFLIVVSYSMLGISGPVFVSILFLGALLMPVVYHAVKAVMRQRMYEAARNSGNATAEVQSEA